MSFLRTLADLSKIRIAALSTLTAAAGYLLSAGRLAPGLLWSCLGVVLAASGACALNQVQEAPLDARMPRTAGRPIPSGRIRRATALLAALLLLAAGLAVLGLRAGAAPALLALLAVLWYNALYTPLKRRTAWAVVPGSLIGAVPPAIGWSAAGGRLLDPACLALCGFLFLWQVPHFWLLLQVRAGEYREAGYPVPTDRLAPEALARVAYAWMAATAGAGLLVAVFGRLPLWSALWLAACGLLLLRAAWRTVRVPGGEAAALCRPAFAAINLYALAALAGIGAGALARP